MIDVSEFQGHIDWAKVHSSGVKVAAIKAGEGLYEKDLFFDYNYPAATRAGILACPYFFAHPKLDPKAQARHFVKLVGENRMKRGMGRLGLDLEVGEGDSPEQLQKWALAFCGVIDPLIRCKMIIYTYSAFAPGIGKALIDHPLWIANYNGKKGVPADGIGDWKRRSVIAHQFTSTGKCPGIEGNVDRSYRFTKTLRRFKNGRVML
jgi:lysozyme